MNSDTFLIPDNSVKKTAMIPLITKTRMAPHMHNFSGSGPHFLTESDTFIHIFKSSIVILPPHPSHGTLICIVNDIEEGSPKLEIIIGGYDDLCCDVDTGKVFTIAESNVRYQALTLQYDSPSTTWFVRT